jgi:competence protein ComEA
LAAALTVAGSLSVPVPVPAQAPPPSIDLSPARAQGDARAGQTVGPFGVRNLTGEPYLLRVYPILLGQNIDGTIIVRTDSAATALARQLVTPSLNSAALAPRVSAAASGHVNKLTRRHNLYGGLIFQATPAHPKGQITAVLRLDARILLDPPPALRHVKFVGQTIRAEQAGPQKLRLYVPIVNRGNYFVNATGVLAVRDSAGKVVAQGPLSRIQVLPGATVELTEQIAPPTVLGPGTYGLLARMRAGGTSFTATGTLVLFGPNTVASEQDKIVNFPVPKAYKGQTADISVGYRNFGNVPSTPRMDIEVRQMTPNGLGTVVKTIAVGTQKLGPGTATTAHASYEVPPDGKPFQLTARLFIGPRQVDTRDVSVTPTTQPSLWERIKNWITDHAVLVILVLLGLLILGALWVMRYIRRIKRGQVGPSAAPSGVALTPSTPPPTPAASQSPAASPRAQPEPTVPPSVARVPSGAVPPPPGVVPPPAGITGAGVDLSTATAEQLQSLPGIGPGAAQRIVAYRDEYGLRSVEDLEQVEGFDADRVAALRGRVRV